MLQALTRQHVDSVVRYGGEEFLLLLPQTDRVETEILAEQLRSSFEEAAIDCGVHRITATASFGVSAVNFADGGSKRY
jgi:diguanylate cyclase (GGDEF)-like protein